MAQSPEGAKAFSDEVQFGHGDEGFGGVPVDMIVDPTEVAAVPAQPGAEDFGPGEVRAAVQAAVDESNERAKDGLHFVLTDVQLAPREQ